jgi:hypothetical protein
MQVASGMPQNPFKHSIPTLTHADGYCMEKESSERRWHGLPFYAVATCVLRLQCIETERSYLNNSECCINTSSLSSVPVCPTRTLYLGVYFTVYFDIRHAQ